ncbi:MAG: flagellar biosynthesis protein [Pseudomonadota bacterium]
MPDAVFHKTMRDATYSRPQPLDQADGLRRMFGASRPRFVAVASNPYVGFSGVLLERLTSAFAVLGCSSLVVDASEQAPAPHELAMLDLAACVEPLSTSVAYLAARGLPVRHVDARGSSASFLCAVADAAPQADVVVVHAPASDLSRLFTARALRPVLLAADHPRSVTQAYAAMKLLALRNGLMSYDLLLSADPQSPRRDRIAEQLGSCADRFLGAVLHDAAVVDPASDVHDIPSAELMRVAQALLAHEEELVAQPVAPAAAWPLGAMNRI